MKENTREISILKRRILEYLEYKGVSKYECYKNTGITNGVLSQSNGLSEDNLMRFLSYYADVSYCWLFTGNGSMLRDSKNSEESKLGGTPNATPISPAEESIIYNMYKDEKAEKERMIRDKDIKIDQLNHELAETKAELAVIKAQFSDYKTYSEEKLRQLEAGVPGGKTSAKHVSTKKHSSPNADDVTSVTAQ